VRKLLAWDRYDTPQAVEAINDLYRNELRLWMNLFQPSVKLLRKIRVGSKLRRAYGPAETPLDRVLASGIGPDRGRRSRPCARAWTPSSWRTPWIASSNALLPWPTAASVPNRPAHPLVRLHFSPHFHFELHL
jgi:hypothetical protein